MTLYTIYEISEILKISERTVMKYIESGKLIAFKPTSGITRISEGNLKKFLENKE